MADVAGALTADRRRRLRAEAKAEQRRGRLRVLEWVAMHSVALGLGILFLLPFVFVLLTSVMSSEQALTTEYWPREWHWENYVSVFQTEGFLTWWRTPFVQLDGRMQTSAYDSMGVVPVGYVLFALGLAAAVGTVWRRAVPALVISFIGYFAARLFVDTWLRQRLVGAVSETTRFSKGQMSALNHAWVLNQYPSNSAGQRVSESVQCLKGGSRCVLHAPEFMHVVYIPASRFWALQGVEFALFGGAALILLAFAAWWTHERIG